MKNEVTSSYLLILLAEDNLDNQLLVDAYLKGSPHRVTYAQNGAEALVLFKTEKFDLVLMDLEMPEMNGYEATRAIRQWEKANQQAPTLIYAYTSKTRADDQNKSILMGCDEYITKPVGKKNFLLMLDLIHQQLHEKKAA